MNPFSLKIKDPELSSKFGDLIMERAQEAQYHILSIFFLSFTTSMSYFFILDLIGKDYGEDIKWRLYENILKFTIYIIIILISRKFGFLKRYGALLMFGAYLIIGAEFYNIINYRERIILR